MAERLEIEITVDTKGAVPNVSKLTSALSGLGTIALKVATVGLAGLVAGSVALAGGLAFAIKEAMEAQGVLAQTNAVIASTGGVAGVSADELSRWATELSLVTQFSDDMV